MPKKIKAIDAAIQTVKRRFLGVRIVAMFMTRQLRTIQAIHNIAGAQPPAASRL